MWIASGWPTNRQSDMARSIVEQSTAGPRTRPSNETDSPDRDQVDPALSPPLRWPSRPALFSQAALPVLYHGYGSRNCASGGSDEHEALTVSRDIVLVLQGVPGDRRRGK